MLISNPVCEHRQRDQKGYNWDYVYCVGTGNQNVLQCMLYRPFFQPISQILSFCPLFILSLSHGLCLFFVFFAFSLSFFVFIEPLYMLHRSLFFFNLRTVLVWLLLIFNIVQCGYSKLGKFLHSMCKLCIVQTKEDSKVRKAAFTNYILRWTHSDA